MKKMCMLFAFAAITSLSAVAQDKKGVKKCVRTTTTTVTQEGDCCDIGKPHKPKPKPKPAPAPAAPKEVVVKVVLEQSQKSESARMETVYRKSCEITDFSMISQNLKYGDQARLRWALSSGCKTSVNISPMVTFSQIDPQSATTDPLYHGQTFMLTAYDHDGYPTTRSLFIPNPEVERVNTDLTIGYETRHRTFGHYLLCIGVPIVGGAIIGGVVYASTRHHDQSSNNGNGTGGPGNVITIW